MLTISVPIDIIYNRIQDKCNGIMKKTFGRFESRFEFHTVTLIIKLVEES